MVLEKDSQSSMINIICDKKKKNGEMILLLSKRNLEIKNIKLLATSQDDLQNDTIMQIDEIRPKFNTELYMVEEKDTLLEFVL